MILAMIDLFSKDCGNWRRDEIWAAVFHQTSKSGYGSPFWIHARWRKKADGGTTKWSTIFNYEFLTGWVVGWPSVLQQMGPVQSYLLCWGVVGIWSAVGQVLGPHAGSVLWRETENDKRTTWNIIKFFTIKVTSHSLYSTCTWKEIFCRISHCYLTEMTVTAFKAYANNTFKGTAFCWMTFKNPMIN